MTEDGAPEEIRSEAVAALRDLIRLERASDFGAAFRSAMRRLKRSGISADGTRLAPLTAEELGVDPRALAEELAGRAENSVESAWVLAVIELFAPVDHVDLPRLLEIAGGLHRRHPWLPAITTRPGWSLIISRLACKLEEVLAPEIPRMARIREKWGVISTYLLTSTPEAEAALQEAVAASARTCERCSAPAALWRLGHVQALCGEHALDFIAEARARSGKRLHRWENAWLATFRPKPGLLAAKSSPTLKRGSLGRRLLRVKGDTEVSIQDLGDLWPADQEFPLTDAECSALLRGYAVRPRRPLSAEDVEQLPAKVEIIDVRPLAIRMAR